MCCLLYETRAPCLGTHLSSLQAQPCGLAGSTHLMWCAEAVTVMVAAVPVFVWLYGSFMSLPSSGLAKVRLLRLCSPAQVLVVVAFLWGGGLWICSVRSWSVGLLAAC